jgi:Spy/CpxP family protein refolding chaperone
MQRSKWLALVLLIGVFVAGIAIGIAVDRAVEHGRPPRRGGLARLTRELNLTAEQKAKFDTILGNREKQICALYAPIRPKMDSLMDESTVIRDSTHEQLRRVLNPDQQAKLDKMHEDAKKRGAQGRRRGCDPGPGGPPRGSGD